MSRLRLRFAAAFTLSGTAAYGAYATWSWTRFFAGDLDEPNAGLDGPWPALDQDADLAGLVRCWYTENGLKEMHKIRPPLRSFAATNAPYAAPQYDACVIGAGIAGLHTALSLAERGKKVIVLEAKRVGCGASGRNGGQLISGFEGDVDFISGEEAEKAILRQTVESGMELTRQRVKKYNIQCDLIESEVFEVALRLERVIETLDDVQHHADHESAPDAGYKWRPLTGEMVREEGLNSPLIQHAIAQPAASLNPMALCYGLARACEEQGAVIHEGSEVVAVNRISPDTADEHFKVRTAFGSLTAKHVVLCTNSAPAALCPRLAACSVFASTGMMVTEPLPKDVLSECIRRDDLIVYDDRVDMTFFRRIAGNRLLFGGLGSPLPMERKTMEKALLTELHHIFPKLQPHVNERRGIAQSWQGGVSLRLPWFAMVGRDAPSGMWHILALGGHGLAPGCAAAETIAKAICYGDEDFKIWQSVNYFRPPPAALQEYLPPSIPVFSTLGAAGANLACHYFGLVDRRHGKPMY